MKLLKHVEVSEREKLRSRLRAVKDVLDAITTVVAEDKESSERMTRAPNRLQNPNWAQETAFELGKQYYANAIIEMIEQALKETPND
jgi:hypothetical protein